MDKNDIRNKSIHKLKNPHYFERYLRLLELFEVSNKSLSDNVYVESHHILPKANDMFPEYADFKKNPWNKINLTARQHFISHWILWKTFQGSQSYAFQCFINQVECKNNKRQDIKVTSRVYEELKIQSSRFMIEQKKNKASYVDKEGNKIYCRIDDSRVLSGELISISKGRKYKPRTDEQKNKAKKSLLKYHRNKKNQSDVSFYRGIEKVTVTKYSDEYYYYMSSNDWSDKCTLERSSFTTAEYNRTREKISWSEKSKKRFSVIRTGCKIKREAVIKNTIAARNKRGWEPGDYDIFMYDKQQDKFITIDQVLFDKNKHIRVSKRTTESKKIINLSTKEILVANPDLPRLPEGFVFIEDCHEVTVFNTTTKLFSKKKRYEIDDDHLEIAARNDNRVRIVDSEGKKRYIPKEIKELYFS
jgi:hypothetical protein